MAKQIGVIGSSTTAIKSIFDVAALTAANLTNLAEAGVIESHFFKVNRTKENLEEAGYQVSGAEATAFLKALVQESLAGRPKEPVKSVADVLDSFNIKPKE